MILRRIWSEEVTAPAASTDLEIYSTTIPSNEEWEVIWIAFKKPADGEIKGIIGEDTWDKLTKSFNISVDHPVILNRKLLSGQRMAFTVSTAAGGASGLTMMVDKVKR